MISERNKVIRSVVAIVFSACAVYYSTNYDPGAERSTASFNPVANCFKALKNLLKNYAIAKGGDVSLVLKSGHKLEGKITMYVRGGLEIRNSRKIYLVTYNQIQSINDEVLSEIEIYKRLLNGDIEQIGGGRAVVNFHDGVGTSNVSGYNFEMGEKNLNFTNLRDGRRMTVAYENVYDVSITDPVKEAMRIRRDVKLYEGEFVTVELKSGEDFNGEIALSHDGIFAEITDIEDPDSIVSVPITDIKSIYQ